ncbi:MAG: acyl-CoA thioesterase II [Deltaproteobacteria bacterium]|nr:acyl-CoA thioesterase II [Deltaproteobacteria bacterium]MBW2360553.1 acyl-CoA thioesterase II [Deltaproteobacteria bacterium]
MSNAYPALAKVLTSLDLETLNADLFLGHPGRGRGPLYGGMVAAQSVAAACRTVPPERRIHSLHSYFLRPGRHDVPIRFAVDRIREGRSFTTRRVNAHQAGETIFSLSASYCKHEDGIAHQEPMPDAPHPDTLPDWDTERAKLVDGPPPGLNAVEIRMVDPWSNEKSAPRQRSWVRVRGPLPDDPIVRVAMLVYLSDRTLLGTAARPHGIPWQKRTNSSLDHSVWFHHEARLDDWLLYVCESPIAHSARGLTFGGLFTPGGVRLASVAQEGLIRTRR